MHNGADFGEFHITYYILHITYYILHFIFWQENNKKPKTAIGVSDQLRCRYICMHKSGRGLLPVHLCGFSSLCSTCRGVRRTRTETTPMTASTARPAWTAAGAASNTGAALSWRWRRWLDSLTTPSAFSAASLFLSLSLSFFLSLSLSLSLVLSLSL